MTCLNPEDVPRLRAALDMPMSALATPAAGLFPEFDQLEAFAGKMLGESYAMILQRCGPASLGGLGG